jgi:hypothetical protein
MGEMGEVFGAMREATRQRHAEWKTNNMATVQKADVVYRTANAGETLLFREPGKPKVDFYPSTGRWRVVGDPTNTRTMGGGAEKFLKWYAAHTR